MARQVRKKGASGIMVIQTYIIAEGINLAFSRRLETKTLNKMIMIYCRKMHGVEKNELCIECIKLLNYAELRIDKCPFGDKKPVCSKCKIHCYKPEMQESVKKVMQYSGPRMFLKSPLLSLRYIYRKICKSNNK